MSEFNSSPGIFYKGASCKILERKRKSSSRASEARPGVQFFPSILDSGFRRNDGVSDFCKRLKGEEKWKIEVLGFAGIRVIKEIGVTAS
jgi:hypothetical protein